VAGGSVGKLVAHLRDGIILKGFSRDFDPARELFHIVRRRLGVAASQEVRVDQMKALFHVKTWGRKDRHMGREPGFPEGDVNRPPDGLYIRTVAEFFDGVGNGGFFGEVEGDVVGAGAVFEEGEKTNVNTHMNTGGQAASGTNIRSTIDTAVALHPTRVRVRSARCCSRRWRFCSDRPVP